MTEQQIIETLATKVMGWHKAEFNGAERWYKECGNPAERINWNPLQNIADAWMLVDKLKEQEISTELHADDGEYIVRVNYDRWFSNKAAPKAICTAMFEYATQL